MPAKKVWMSLLEKDENLARKMMGQVASYGLAVNGHFWSNVMDKMEWMGPRKELLDPAVALLLIVGTRTNLADPNTRFGLSLLSLTVQAGRGNGFPTFILYGGEAPDLEDLPTPLKHAHLISASAAFGPKLVARANMPFQPTPTEYRFDVYGIPGIGLWLEVGPAGETWKGVMAGVSGGDIDAHGVGPKGQLPTGKMVLNYAQKGLKINLGTKEYTAWAVQNELDPNTSYFFRATGQPDSIIFGPFAHDDQAEVFSLRII
jgi:hypothetical protein